MKRSQSNFRVKKGFSLVELLAAMTILLVLMLLMTMLMNQVQSSWRFGEDRISQFREARVAFDLITKNMSQATMNTYWDYSYNSQNQIQSYKKRSELHFYVEHADAVESKLGLSNRMSGHAVFFQAPLGFSVEYRNLGNLFNGRGYMVVHGSDRLFRPSFVETDRVRYRLMEFRPPAEANQVFQDAIDEIEADDSAEQFFNDWWNQGLGIGHGGFEDHLNPLAENIILLVVSPMDSLDSQSKNRYSDSNDIAPNYTYDSNNPAVVGFGQQVPPLVRVTMVAIDESTAVRLEDKYKEAKPNIVPSGLFRIADNYNRNLSALIEEFNEGNQDDTEVTINYRVFSTTIMLRASKWITPSPGGGSPRD